MFFKAQGEYAPQKSNLLCKIFDQIQILPTFDVYLIFRSPITS
jgi:hypothetical protein